MPDLHDDLRAYFDHVVEASERGVGERPLQSPRRGHRTRRVLAVVAAAAVIVIVAVFVWTSDAADHGVVSTPSTPPTSPTGSVAQLGGVWRELPTTNLSRSGYSLKSTYLFWTGDAVLTIDTESASDGVLGEIYRPSDGSVRRIADSGLEWRANAAVVWTGSEVIVAGGSNGPGIAHAAAAYNPATDTWRALPDPPGSRPFRQTVGEPAVWTGTEMVAWRSGLAFNPATNSWRPIAQPPVPIRGDEAVVMTPQGVFVWGGCRPVPGEPQCEKVIAGDELSDGAIYNPETDTWTTLPASPLGKGDHPTAVWTGTGVVVLLNIPDSNATVYAAAYNPTTQTWRALPPPPFVGLSYAVTVWSGTYVITHTRRDGGTTAFDPASDTWYTLPAGPTRDRQSAVWAGDQLVIAGGHPSATPWTFSFTTSQGSVKAPSTTTANPPTRSGLPPGVPAPTPALARAPLPTTSATFVVTGGNIWAVEDAALVAYDANTLRQVASTPVRSGTVGIAASSDGVWLLTLTPGSPSHLTLVDRASLKVRFETDLPGVVAGATNPGVHVAATPGAAWVGIEGLLYRVDPQTAAITLIGLSGGEVYRMAVNRTSLWIATFGSSSIHRVDLATNAVTDISTGFGAYTWSIAADESAAWATMVYADQPGQAPSEHLVRVDADTLAVTTYRVPAITVITGDNQIWVQILDDPGTTTTSTLVGKFDPQSGTITRTVEAAIPTTIGNPSGGPTFTTADGNLWVPALRITP